MANPLKPYQTVIQLGTLYAIAHNGGDEQLTPSLQVIGGTVDIYGSEQDPSPSAPTGMYKTSTGFVGIDTFAVVPSYFYVAQNSGTTTSIILSGLNVKAI